MSAVLGSSPLTPLSMLHRAEAAFANQPAVIDGDRWFTYAVLADRSRRFAGLLTELGVEPGDRVSVMAPNTPAMLAAHFAIPMAGGVINALNPRLSEDELVAIVSHAGSSAIVADASLGAAAEAVAQRVDSVSTVIQTGPESGFGAQLDRAEPTEREVKDESELLALNYTSGTTGQPKGVMYSHRGAFLAATAMVAHSILKPDSVFLWTLPMFHCNGWCYPWAVTGAGGTHVALRRPDPTDIWQAIATHGVTHFNAAPTVLSRLVDSPQAHRLNHPIEVATGGAPPSDSLLARLEELNIAVTHLYGLTETYGPAVICDRRGLDQLDPSGRAELQARQGVADLINKPMRAVGADGNDVPHDGVTQGEVLIGGNGVMIGYYRNPEATAAATMDGWLRTGDIGVIHPDGHLQLVDRAKDIIISGGENIASIEVEHALMRHDAVAEAAVVGRPDPQWGEVPVAFVELRPGASATADELIAHVKTAIATYKAPREVHLVELPRTATGKIRKVDLRNQLSGPDG